MDFPVIRLAAVNLRPYYAVALCALTLVERKGLQTCAIDQYGRVYWDPALDWTVQESAWALIHELNHWIRVHHARSEPYFALADCKLCEAKRINICQDMEINDDIEREGGRLPRHDKAQFPRKYGLEPGKLWEQYYEELRGKASERSEHNEDCADHLCGSAAHGVAMPYEAGAPGAEGAPPGFTKPEADLIRDQVAREVLSQQYGNLPAGLMRWAKQRLQPPQIPWERELSAQTQSAAVMARGVGDYSYAKISRRYGMVTKVIMPSVVRPQPEVAVVVDTSGSMREDHELALVLAEIPGIVRALGQQRVPVICCDTVAAPAQLIAHVNQLELVGGGGTDMGAGIEAALKLHAKVIIVLTDGYTPWPAELRHGVHVVVGLVSQGERVEVPPPFNKRVVRIRIQEEKTE